MLVKFARNAHGRDFVVGDIHGRFDLLRQLLAAINFSEDKDRMFSVGDLVDRGAYSEECVEYLMRPWFFAVRGNHEQMAIDYSRGQCDGFMYSLNGGDWFIDLDEARQKTIADHLDALPYAMEIYSPAGRVGVIHAECPGASWDAAMQRLEDVDAQNVMLWDRSRMLRQDTYEDLDLMVFGHTVIKSPLYRGNAVNIDTGAFKTGVLTCIELSSPPAFHQVPSQ